MDLSYHRLERSSPKHPWWRPLVTAVIGVAIFFVLSAAVSIGWLALRISGQPRLLSDPDALLDPLLELDLTDPLTFVLATVSIAVMLPSVVIARSIMGPRPFGVLSSVAGRIRWRWLARCIPLAILAFGVVFGVQFLIPAEQGAANVAISSTTGLLVLLALVLTPLQATAEEYVFRGFLMQTVGAWLRHPVWAIVLPVPLFALGHTQYGLLGLLDVAIFGLTAGYLTWRTGGLEAAIVAHVINNTTLFVLGAFGLVENGESEGSVLGLLSTAVIMGSFAALVVWRAKRTGLATTRAVSPPDPSIAQWAPPASVGPPAPGAPVEVLAGDSQAAGRSSSPIPPAVGDRRN